MWVGLPQAGADENTGGPLMLTHRVKPGRVDVEYMDGALCTRFIPSPGGESNFPGGGLCKHRAGPDAEAESAVGRSSSD